ncbi:hypothetical protein C8R45DRAFT_986131 [Mycena sanguinolenta]|nr:hypothetical protein C8R45DRAFT_986131 [Mycena sanguinolenta]
MSELQSCLCVSEVLFRILNFLGVRVPHLLARRAYYESEDLEKKIRRVNIGQSAYLIFQERVNRFITEVGNTVRLRRKAVASTVIGIWEGKPGTHSRGQIFLREETQNPAGKCDFGRHIVLRPECSDQQKARNGGMTRQVSSRSHWTGYERTVTSRRRWKRTAEVEPEIEYSGIEREVLDVAQS